MFYIHKLVKTRRAQIKPKSLSDSESANTNDTHAIETEKLKLILHSCSFLSDRDFIEQELTVHLELQMTLTSSTLSHSLRNSQTRNS